MLARLGFVSSVLSEELTTSRTCRLKNATRQRIRELVTENLAALDKVVTWLERRRVLLYRMTSNLIPFGSHASNAVRWWEESGPELQRIGTRMRAIGIRTSTHPGQFTVLNSPHDAIVQASIDELVYHARLMDVMGLDATNKIVLHIGGLYGGTKVDAIDRFVRVASKLPEPVLRRLVVENDDRLFHADDALTAARVLGVPVVFDWLHHRVNLSETPSAEVIAACFETWKPADGRPKVHVSSHAVPGPRGAHADYVDPRDLLSFMEAAPDVPFDCMLEAKQKDKALLKLRDDLRALKIVETDLKVQRAAR